MKRIGFLVILGLFVMAGTEGAGARPEGTLPVSFDTEDGRTLRANYLPPKTGEPVLILLHGLASSKWEWRGLISRLRSRGWGALAYDARGHGQSSTRFNQKDQPVGYKYFGQPGPGSPWERMIGDVGRAIRFLKKEKNVPRDSFVLMGASLGANVALNYAFLSRFENPVVLLSPGLNYQEIKTDKAIEAAGRTPVLMVVSPKDRYAYQSARALKKHASAAHLWTNVSPGHGVQMFDGQLEKRLLQWIDEKL